MGSMKNLERLEMLPDLINAAAVQSYIIHGSSRLNNADVNTRQRERIIDFTAREG